jgi:hypothetical protein
VVAQSGDYTAAQVGAASTSALAAEISRATGVEATKADLVGGVVPTAQIPALALTATVVVASQAAMLALTTSQVQPGDVAVRTDGTGTFILTATDPSQISNWTRLNAPTDAVTTVNGQSGTVVLAASDVGAYVRPTDGIPSADMSAAVQAALGAVQPSHVVTRTSAYTVAVGDFVRGDATSGPVGVTLPAAPAVGALVAVQKVDSGANVVTATPAGGGTINGDPNATIVAQWAGAILEHLGSNTWTVTSVFNSSGPPGGPGPIGPTGGSGVQGIFGAGVVGGWYALTGIPIGVSGSVNTSAGLAIVGTPFIAPEAMTIDALGCYVGGAAAGATVRLGLLTPRAINPFRLALSSVYADKLVEAAAPVDASTTGDKIAPLGTPLALAAGQVVVGIALIQGGAPSIWHDGNSQLTNSPWGQSSIQGGPLVGVTATGLTSGAIPSTFTPTAFRSAGIGGSVWYRRSA